MEGFVGDQLKTGANRQAKPATTSGTETGEFYFEPSSTRRSVCSFVRQLRGPVGSAGVWAHCCQSPCCTSP
jgi:hypothetical protein